MTFSWDPEKAAANVRKHRVGFHEAASIFDDPLSTTFPDPDPSFDEQRYLTIGQSRQARILVVAHVDRSSVIRVITARQATARERRFYAEG